MNVINDEDFDVAYFEGLCDAKGWTTYPARAGGLGVSVATISRVCRGLQRPGQVFIHKCRLVFPSDFDELFPLRARRGGPSGNGVDAERPHRPRSHPAPENGRGRPAQLAERRELSR